MWIDKTYTDGVRICFTIPIKHDEIGNNKWVLFGDDTIFWFLKNIILLNSGYFFKNIL
jgi:hypothetical protein